MNRLNLQRMNRLNLQRTKRSKLLRTIRLNLQRAKKLNLQNKRSSLRMNLKCLKISQGKRKLNWDHQFAKLLLKARKSFSNRSQASSSQITRKKVGNHLEKLRINTSKA